MGNRIVTFSLNNPKRVMWFVAIMVVILAAMFPRIHVDTDPENMLPTDQSDRVVHNTLKKQFSLHDMIVVGVVNDTHADGIYNHNSLAAIHQLSSAIEQIDGVIREDLRSLATADNVTQEGAGTIRFEWMMNQAPKTQQAVSRIKEAVNHLPMLQNTLVSGDGKAAGIYVPIVEKDQSYRIAEQIREIITSLDSDDQFHITGLPIAEDTFGVEMFKQMAISAPLAGLVIFIMLWIFFRNLSLIIAPMLMAMAVVISTMGLLIGMGYTVHIMSSMIPIFLMPIAVVDSVHLLSEFADRYKPGKSPKQVVTEVMEHLFTPMLFTSVTSSIGFASLALTPIPPVQVFGIYTALGIALAFVLTVTFIPAYIALLSEKKLATLGSRLHEQESHGLLAKALPHVGDFSIHHARIILPLVIILFSVSVYGISKIQINDNPVYWFDEQHEIQVADRALNSHFAGTYNAFLVLTHESAESVIPTKQIEQWIQRAKKRGVDLTADWAAIQKRIETEQENPLEALNYELQVQLFNAEIDSLDYWQELADMVGTAITDRKYFQKPDALHYIESLQQALDESGYVGKSSAITDLVKTVYRELLGGDQQNYRIPTTSNAVAQTILSFQGSHRPQDLWHMVTPSYHSAAIWLQLNSGDNIDMTKVIQFVERYVEQNPLPDNVRMDWGGLTYINVVWQDEMVTGMVGSLIGAFLAVGLIMILLFRSVTFGLLAMIPLTVTITLIYGVIGFIGKDYDMPVAILSSLTLGLSVDFAIHFLERTRSLYKETGDWLEALKQMYQEPARAISRNAIVIAIGFTPLLLAPLTPYQTVGIFLAAIMAISCVVTFVALPAVIRLIHPWLK
ncbi:MAG: MMPL family transporter [Pseudomonadales bacterium]|nr:MMPL family transporter [Pseudomonadales bacterium]